MISLTVKKEKKRGRRIHILLGSGNDICKRNNQKKDSLLPDKPLISGILQLNQSFLFSDFSLRLRIVS